MGIKHFYLWFKNNHSEHLQNLQRSEDFPEDLDTLLIDMNGVFHHIAQQVYEYGEFDKGFASLFRKPPGKKEQMKYFRKVCEYIDFLLKFTGARKRLVLGVDGVVPRSKQSQQRSRRFRNQPMQNQFNPSSISTGTKFMNQLCKYVEWYIKYKISTDNIWKNIEVIFSSERVPGEGEHKLIQYIRLYSNMDGNEKFCIHGLDADLFMLSLGTGQQNIFLLREDTYNKNIDFNLVNIGGLRQSLLEDLYWENDQHEFEDERCIFDFILICFLVGNDFLPHIPNIEIIEDGLEIMFDIYRSMSCHLTSNKGKFYVFDAGLLGRFLSEFVSHEQQILNRKMNNQANVYPNEILEKSSVQQDDGSWNVNIDNYRTEYNKKFENSSIANLCHEYFQGIQWVLAYYSYGPISWEWEYPHYYAPFAKDMAENADSFQFCKFEQTEPSEPIQQLVSVLPIKAGEALLPRSLANLLKTTFSEYCPERFEVDLAGKRRDWEAVVLIPNIPLEDIKREYNAIELDTRESIPNHPDHTKKYVYSDFCRVYKNTYGTIKECHAVYEKIDL